eukprot:TRINITY_DN15877_c0_g1_i1.p1 TRINITY_DN15877_c0_g1~~TRINITY_DN15877_c0_g1_i1.p1  ORF type:complete len:167 (-),score=49.60 TRINITY_DN15877_c0_g1_i1:258-692(-)
MGWGGEGKGGKGGKGKMDMMWQMMEMMWGGGGGGKGKGGGKFGKGSHWLSQHENFAKRCPPPKKVFIGGLPVLGQDMSHDLNKRLKEHCNQAGTCTYAEIGRKGTGVACFQSDEDAATAVTLLSGSVFEGSVLEVNPWVKKQYY